MNKSETKIAMRELEIILEGYQGVETMIAEGFVDGAPAGKSLVPLNLLFEITLANLRKSLAGSSASGECSLHGLAGSTVKSQPAT